MFYAIREYFTPPVFGDDEEKTNTARILFLALKFYYGLSFCMLVGDIFVFVRKLEAIFAVFTFVIILIIAKSLANKGKIRAAGFLIVIFMWCIYTPAIWLSGGLRSLMSVSYIVISILSGLLLGRRASISVAVISCFTLFVMYLLETVGIYGPKYFPFPSGSVLFLWFATFLIIVPMINLALQILRESLVLKRKEVEERRMVEAALRESENKYRTIFENIQDVFYRVNLEGIMEELSPSIYHYSGFTREELIGKPVDMVYYNPEDRDEFVNKILVNDLLTDTELLLKDKKGNLVITSASAHKLFDKDGNITGFEGSLRNITERKKMEAALVESEEKMRLIIEGTSYLFFYTQDNNTKLTYVSPSVEKITGYSVEEWKEKRHWFATDSEINNYAKNKTYTNLRDETGNETILLEIKHADGHNILLEVYETPIYKNHLAVGFHGIAHDITDRKKAEDALKENETLLIAARDKAEEMNRLKTSILNNMSHELRTPLIGIMGFAEILEAEIKEPYLQNMVTNIASSGRRLSDTLNMILDLSKMEAEQLKVVHRLINLSEVTKQRVAGYEGAAGIKELTLNCIINDDNINVNTDERLYSQILDNLINNAVKFTNTGGICIVLDKETRTLNDETNNFVILKVIDTGIGVATEDYKLIFEEYRQLSTGLSRSFQGTGLGLTITKRFVELLGGEITIDSKLGNGTTFTFTLPV